MLKRELLYIAIGAFGMGCSPDGGASRGPEGESAGGGPDEGVVEVACAPPADTPGAALCLRFEPEPMQLLPDPHLDGFGVLLVEVFATPAPDETTQPLAVQVLPPEGAPEVPVFDLPELRLEGLPETVYIRTHFVDNPMVLQTGLPLWGLWFGGADLSRGLASPTLLPVQLAAGAGTVVTQPLTAVRALLLHVALAPGVVPLDDGQGPLGVTTWRTPTPSGPEDLTGIWVEPCVDLARGPATVGVPLLGAGPHYVLAVLDDFAVGGEVVPGSVVSPSTRQGQALTIAESQRLPLAPDQYGIEQSVELTRIEPIDPVAPPQPFACPPP